MYKNGTYVAFDGNGKPNPIESDLKYLGLLRSWKELESHEFTFSDSHLKTYQVSNGSSLETLKARLLERMRNSKNKLLILSSDTNWDRGLLNFEIEKAVDFYKIPLIIAYTECDYILEPSYYKKRWPEALSDRIVNGTARCIHIPFKQKPIAEAIYRFSVNSKGDDILTSPLHSYNKDAYVNWGYILK